MPRRAAGGRAQRALEVFGQFHTEKARRMTPTVNTWTCTAQTARHKCRFDLWGYVHCLQVARRRFQHMRVPSFASFALVKGFSLQHRSDAPPRPRPSVALAHRHELPLTCDKFGRVRANEDPKMH